MQPLVALDVRHFHLVEIHRRARAQHLVDLGEIVVAGRGDEGHALAGELLLGEAAPFAHALEHELLEQLVAHVLVGR